MDVELLMFFSLVATGLVAIALIIVLSLGWTARRLLLWSVEIKVANATATAATVQAQLVKSENGLLPIQASYLDSIQFTQAALALAAQYIESNRLPAPVPSSISYAPHLAYKSENEPAPQLPAPDEAKPFEVKDFWQIYSAGQLPESGFMLGYNDDGQPVVAGWRQLYSALIGGMSGSGKSTLIRSVLAQSALQGGRFVVLDKHFGAGEESLGASLMPLRSRMLCDVAASEVQMIDALRWVGDIGLRRLSGQDADKSPVILIVDETTALLARSNVAGELQRILGEIAQETRKVGVFALCIGQQWSSTIMDTTIRNSFASMLSCRARRDVARIMSGNNEFAKLAEGLHIGQAVWMTPGGEVVRLAVPNTTQAHISQIAATIDSVAVPLGSQTSNRLPTDFQITADLDASEVSRKSLGSLPEVALDAKARRAIELFLAGKTHSDVLREVWGVTGSGRSSQNASYEFQNIIREWMLQKGA